MGVLEELTNLKSQGMSDNQIYTSLQEKGYSPKQIQDALGQAEIKSAISGGEMANYEPQTEEISEEYVPAPEGQAQNQAQPQEYDSYYSQEGYNQGGYSQGGYDSSTMIAIAEQVFQEKIKEIDKKINDFNEFKTITQTKVENISERLKKIETTIDQLQIKILGEVASYSDDLRGIKKEMSMIENSFGKLVNPLTDKAEKKHSKKSSHKKTSKKKSKKK